MSNIGANIVVDSSDINIQVDSTQSTVVVQDPIQLSVSQGEPISANVNVESNDINFTLEPLSAIVNVETKPVRVFTTGGFGDPGGQAGELQFNKFPGFDGVPGTNWDGSNLTLGNVTDIRILGGQNGFVLQTDGTGNLGWTLQSGNGTGGNGTPGGANTQIQFNDEGSFAGFPGFIFNKINQNVNMPNNINIGSNASVGSNLSVSMNANVGGNANVGNNLDVGQRITIKSSLDPQGDIRIDGNSPTGLQLSNCNIVVSKGTPFSTTQDGGFIFARSLQLGQEQDNQIRGGELIIGDTPHLSNLVAFFDGGAVFRRDTANGPPFVVNSEALVPNLYAARSVNADNSNTANFATNANNANTANFALFVGTLTGNIQTSINRVGTLDYVREKGDENVTLPGSGFTYDWDVTNQGTFLNASKNELIDNFRLNIILPADGANLAPEVGASINLKLLVKNSNGNTFGQIISSDIVNGEGIGGAAGIDFASDPKVEPGNSVVGSSLDLYEYTIQRTEQLPPDNLNRSYRYILKVTRLNAETEGDIIADNIDVIDTISANNITVTGVLTGDGGNLSNITVETANFAESSNTASTANTANIANTALSVAGANVIGAVANATFATNSGSANTANTVTTNAQPNITSVGTLGSLNVDGTITTGNLNADFITGNLTTPSQTFITSVGTLTGLTVNGNATISGSLKAGGPDVSIGADTNAGTRAVSIGDHSQFSPAQSGQGDRAISIGWSAGTTDQQQDSVAIGSRAGEENQGQRSVAIGYFAGRVNQANNSIVINASGTDLAANTANALFVKPIRTVSDNTGLKQLYYDPSTGEIVFYDP